MLTVRGRKIYVVSSVDITKKGEVVAVKEEFDWKDAMVDSAIFGASAFFGALIMAFDGGVTVQEVCVACTLFGGAFIAFLRVKRGIPEKV